MIYLFLLFMIITIYCNDGQNQIPDYRKKNMEHVLDFMYKFNLNRKEISVLDIGCDPTGYEENLIAENAKFVVGINLKKYNKNFPEEAQKNAKENVRYVDMDATNLTFSNNTFDFIYILSILSNILTT